MNGQIGFCAGDQPGAHPRSLFNPAFYSFGFFKIPSREIEEKMLSVVVVVGVAGLFLLMPFLDRGSLDVMVGGSM